jgi:hypothetical protein
MARADVAALLLELCGTRKAEENGLDVVATGTLRTNDQDWCPKQLREILTDQLLAWRTDILLSTTAQA